MINNLYLFITITNKHNIIPNNIENNVNNIFFLKKK